MELDTTNINASRFFMPAGCFFIRHGNQIQLEPQYVYFDRNRYWSGIFSLIRFFPDIFPEFKTESGTVSFYFEATAVILTLVLLGQLLKLEPTVRQVEQ
jgi:hypothetical protein